jgi:hypothetical protein
MSDDDDYCCPGCEADMRDPEHYGCTFCGNCECQGEC